MQLCEDDDALGIMVQRLLKLTPEGWSSACQHASQAVEVHFWQRHALHALIALTIEFGGAHAHYRD